MHTLHDLANASFNPSLVSQVGDILPALADDHASFFRGDNCSKGQLGLSIFLICLRRRLSVWAEARLIVVEPDLVHGLHQVISIDVL